MASPVAHSLVGVAIGSAIRPRCVKRPVHWYLFSAFVACAADLDLLAGLWTGNINQFHHGPTHSLAAMGIFSAAVATIAWPWWPDWWRVAASTALLYGSHLLIDAVCGHPHWEAGQQLLWPFSHESYDGGWYLLPGIRHGFPGDAAGAVWREIVSWNNVVALSREIVLFLPVLVLSLFLQNIARRRSPAAEVSSSHPATIEEPMELAELRGRLDRVETENRWMKRIGIVALFGLAVATTRGGQNGIVEADGFFLRDDRGQIRAALQVKREGREPYLIFYDDQKRERVAAGVDGEGQPLFALLDEREKPRLVARVRKDGKPTVALFSEDDTLRLSLGINEMNEGQVTFLNADAEVVRKLP